MGGLLSFTTATALDWQSLGPHRVAALAVPAEGRTGFTSIEAAATGIRFTNQLSATRSLTNQVYLNGSGVAAGDVDGDGWCDLYFCGLDSPNELYRNLGGWRFEPMAAQAGVACADQASTGAALADLDGDGDLDLLVNAIARGTRLFLNDGRGRFTEATDRFGLNSRSGAMSLALADVDGDGFLDLYVVNYRTATFRDEPDKRFTVLNQGGQFVLREVDGRPANAPDLLGRFTVDPATGLVEHGEADAFYRNVDGQRLARVEWGDGSFLDETGKPVAIPYDWGLSAMFHDVNGDGAPDLYVCNDFQSEDRLWINRGDGRFQAAPAAALRQTSLFSMGVDFADLDRDGHDELFVADMLSRDHVRRQTQVMDRAAAAMHNSQGGVRPQYSRNTLFWNRGDGTFAEFAQLAGVAASEWSWCPAFLDVDLDGSDDLIVTAGHERDAQNIDVAREIDQAKTARKIPWKEQIEMRRRFPRLESPLMAFRNQGNRTFAFTSPEWGFHTAQVSQGLALADLDSDGDLDLAVNALNGPALLYRNETAAPRLAVRLRGTAPNKRGIGARITVRQGAVPSQSLEMTGGGRYLSSDDPLRTFAAGRSSSLDIHVRWRNGRETVVTGARPNRLYEIAETDSRAPSTAPPPAARPLFEDVSSILNHRHQDQPFDDFQRQPLLPRQFSQLGPGLSWFDLDGDGWDELLIGSGRTGQIALFKNREGKLERLGHEALGRPGTRDRTTLLGWRHGPEARVLVGSANYEDGLTNGPIARQYIWGTAAMDDSLPGSSASTGPLALADADGDGDLDLFLGARIAAARYPLPVSSTYFRNDDGKFVFDPGLNAPFQSVGLVSAALWSDLTGDAAPELVLACDGGPLRVFELREGRFHELTERLGLIKQIGWWNSVTTGDFNGDGRLDVVVGNWGRNSRYEGMAPLDYRLYFEPVPAPGFIPIVESYHDRTLGREVPLRDRDALAGVFPELQQRYPTFAAFSTASISEVMSSRLARFESTFVNTLDSTIFFNRGGQFEPRSLPFEAQLSPAFGLAVGDADGDGHEDLFLAQNFFGVPPGLSRLDGGRGLLLRGDGGGGFTPISARASGLDLPGEGRGAAFCDFDHDGRLDLAVGQNSGPTRLYRNAAAAPGLRLRLRGSGLNSEAIGAGVRLVFADGSLGPKREIRAGEGYWSQAGSTVILGTGKTPVAVEVQWRTGQTQRVSIPAGARELTIPQPVP